MKILILTLEYPPQIGGIAAYTYRQAKHWPVKSDQVIVYAPKMAGDASFDRQNPWPVIRRQPYFRLIWPHWLRMLIQVWQIIRQEKVDMIHVHHVLPAGYVVYLLNKLKRIPYILFFHGLDFGYALKTKSKAKKLAKVGQLAEKIVVNSNFVKNRVIEKFPDWTNKIQVIYPCPSLENTVIDSNKLEELKQKYNPDHLPTILTCARLVARKGQDMVIKSLPKVVGQVPDFRYLICGQGDYKAELEKLVKQYNLAKNVVFIDFVPQDELPYLYSLADVLAMPARELADMDAEGFGIVFLEANLFGRPVIAGKSGGMPEAIDHGRTGILVDPLSVEEISQAIVKLLTDKELANHLGQQGQARVRSQFSWEIQLGKLF